MVVVLDPAAGSGDGDFEARDKAESEITALVRFEQSGRCGSCRQAKPAPARHLPGAWSARSERCSFQCTADQTPKGDGHEELFKVAVPSLRRGTRSAGRSGVPGAN